MCRQAFRFALCWHLSRCECLEKKFKETKTRKSEREWEWEKDGEWMKEWGMFSDRLSLFTSSVDIFFILTVFSSCKLNVLRENNGRQREKNVLFQFVYYEFVGASQKSMRLNLTSHYDANFMTVSISVPAVKPNLGSMNGKLIRTNFKAKHKEIYRAEPSVSHRRTLTQHKFYMIHSGHINIIKMCGACCYFFLGVSYKRVKAIQMRYIPMHKSFYSSRWISSNNNDLIFRQKKLNENIGEKVFRIRNN